MKLNDMFPSNYLKTEDLQGKRVKVTIYETKRERIVDDEKPVVYFREKKKGLVLNVTNGKMIKSIAGSDESDDWEGAQIVLYATEVDFRGERVPAIRIDRVKDVKQPGRLSDAAENEEEEASA